MNEQKRKGSAPKSSPFRREGVRTKKAFNPWGMPVDVNFPRRHLWEWEGDLGIKADETEQKEQVEAFHSLEDSPRAADGMRTRFVDLRASLAARLNSSSEGQCIQERSLH